MFSLHLQREALAAAGVRVCSRGWCWSRLQGRSAAAPQNLVYAVKMCVREDRSVKQMCVCLLQVKHKMSSWETMATMVTVMKMTVVVTDRQAAHDDRPH